MNVKNKYIGIWGYGVVGKSAARFIAGQGAIVSVMNKAPLSQTDNDYCKKNNIAVFDESNIEGFFESNDYVLSSPGIDLDPVWFFSCKFLTELDLFQHFFKKPVIAITGTVGKTTLTHCLTQILNSEGCHAIAGGNIGTPMLDLIAKQDELDYAVLELSSFQLEYTQTFAPDIAIWTTFFPNHLDRHKTIKKYFWAKERIFAYQKPNQIAIITKAIENKLSDKSRSKTVLIDNYNNDPSFSFFPDSLFFQTKLALAATLDTLNIAPTKKYNFDHLEHRLELVKTVKNITFYNDSKSTIAESTLEALKSLGREPITLIFGGLSKGVNREPIIEQMKPYVKHICCFGQEVEKLAQWCKKQDISYSTAQTLEQAFKDAIIVDNPVVLFSPGGASFDLFKNFEERGKAFKTLVGVL